MLHEIPNNTRPFASDDPALYQETAEAVKWEEQMGSFLLRPVLNSTESRRPFR